jgi:anti-sigma factor (TIGR02949 family)
MQKDEPMPDTAPEPLQLSCEDCRDLLSEYLDKEISPEHRAAIEHHLATCTRCVTESTRLQGLKNIVKHWEGVRGTSNFRAAVMTRFISESQQIQPGKLAVPKSEVEDRDDPKRIPPIWVLTAAIVLAVIVYYAILYFRGAHVV